MVHVVGASWISCWVGSFKHDGLLVLFNSAHVLLRELTGIQKGGTVDTALLYILATVDWVILATVGIGIILDAVIRHANLQRNKKTQIYD